MVQGGLRKPPLWLARRIIVQLILSVAASIVALAIGVPRQGTAFGGFLAVDVSLLLESLLQLGLVSYTVHTSWIQMQKRKESRRPDSMAQNPHISTNEIKEESKVEASVTGRVSRAPSVAVASPAAPPQPKYPFMELLHGRDFALIQLPDFPPPPPWAIIGGAFLLLTLVATLQKGVCSLPLLVLVALSLACWSTNILDLKSAQRIYQRMDPVLRLFLALWIAAEYAHSVVAGLARDGHVGYGYGVDDYVLAGRNTSATTLPPPPAAPPSGVWSAEGLNPWVWVLGDPSNPVAWLQTLVLYLALGWIGYMRIDLAELDKKGPSKRGGDGHRATVTADEQAGGLSRLKAGRPTTGDRLDARQAHRPYRRAPCPRRRSRCGH